MKRLTISVPAGNICCGDGLLTYRCCPSADGHWPQGQGWAGWAEVGYSWAWDT